MNDFIQALPKTETHLHIEGALPYELLAQWDPQRWPPDPAFRARSYRYATFPDFERILLDHALPYFTTAERYHEAARAIFAKHVAQNVRYVETSFHLPVTHFTGIPGPEIVDAIRTAAPAGLEVRVFTGMLRTDIGGELRPTIDRLHAWEHLAGVDLHGFEQMATHPDTAAVWARLRAAGKVTKCHAGEFDGAARVREAIEVLGVRRIQHGVRAVEDPAVVRLAAETGTTFDVCPISNVGLQVVPAIAGAPDPAAHGRRRALHGEHGRSPVFREFAARGIRGARSRSRVHARGARAGCPPRLEGGVGPRRHAAGDAGGDRPARRGCGLALRRRGGPRPQPVARAQRMPSGQVRDDFSPTSVTV